MIFGGAGALCGAPADEQTSESIQRAMTMLSRETIFDEIRTVAVEQGKTLAPLTDDLALLDSGLDSLCFAILISRLEDLTGRDPFGSSDGLRFPRTIGELIAFYDESLV
jgi:hypothetical protein